MPATAVQNPAETIERRTHVRRGEWTDVAREAAPLLGASVAVVTGYCVLDLLVPEVRFVGVVGPLIVDVASDWAGKWIGWSVALAVLLAFRRGGMATLRNEYATCRALVSALLHISLFLVVVSFFIAWKAAFPAILPFAFDLRLMELDRALHFGEHPWRLLHPFLASPIRTVLLDWLYFLWYPVLAAVLIWLSWTRDRVLRLQFFLALLFAFVIYGSGIAPLLSSAGPAFFGRVVPTGIIDPYAPLIVHLQTVNDTYPVLSLRLQDRLWARYTGGSGWMEGIAAMPSMHVAFAVLWALAAWRVHRGLGMAFWVFVLIIQAGSIYTGFHYAVDGYLMIALVPPVWWAMGRFSRFWLRPAAEDFSRDPGTRGKENAHVVTGSNCDPAAVH
mgnify:CR=1 FL=1